jgi:hypothetical protein
MGYIQKGLKKKRIGPRSSAPGLERPRVRQPFGRVARKSPPVAFLIWLTAPEQRVQRFEAGTRPQFRLRILAMLEAVAATCRRRLSFGDPFLRRGRPCAGTTGEHPTALQPAIGRAWGRNRFLARMNPCPFRPRLTAGDGGGYTRSRGPAPTCRGRRTALNAYFK